MQFLDGMALANIRERLEPGGRFYIVVISGLRQFIARAFTDDALYEPLSGRDLGARDPRLGVRQPVGEPQIAADGTGERTFFCVGDVKQAIYGWRGGG